MNQSLLAVFNPPPPPLNKMAQVHGGDKLGVHGVGETPYNGEAAPERDTL